MEICFNGKFIKDESNISVSPFFDFAQFGYSVFETFRTYDSTCIFAKELHLDRLFMSLKILKFLQKDDKCLREELSENLEKIVQKNSKKGKDLRIKVFLCHDFYWIKSQFLDPFPESAYQTGVEVCDQVYERAFAQAKYANPAYLFFRKIQPKNCFETIFFNASGYLREGNISNVFVVSEGKIKTSSKNVLLGITREKVLKTAAKLSLKVEECEIHKKEVLQAKALFLTNTTKEVLPIGKWGEWRGKNFSIAHLLRENFPRGIRMG